MYDKQIDEYIKKHEKEFLQDVIDLCSIDSTKMPYKEGMPFGEGPAKALQKAFELADKYGFEYRNYDNYAGAIDLNDKEKMLDILAHLDVVPAGEGWSVTEPFKPIIKDKKIYGRGTSDDKGPAMAAFYALRLLKDLNIPLTKNVRLILGTDEESGSSCIKHYYKFEKEAPMTFTPDGEYPVVNIEKGRLDGHFIADFEKSTELPRLKSIKAGTRINVVPPKATAVIEGFDFEDVIKTAKDITKETGIKFEFDLEPDFMITAYGKNAHASTPDEGNNAITGLLLLLTKLKFKPAKNIEIVKGLYDLMPHGQLNGENLGIKMQDKKSGELTLVFSMLDINEDSMEGYFDLRAPVCAEPEFVLLQCKNKFIEKGINFINTDMSAPHEVDENSRFIKVLNSCYEEVTGLKGGCISIGGGTYVHNIKNGVAFGAVFPETNTRMHGADEFMPIAELLASIKIFAKVIIELCS